MSVSEWRYGLIYSKEVQVPNSKIHNDDLREYSQVLRRNMTEQERKLWYCFLNKCKFKFKRQVTVGNYIVDFYCKRAKLVIELDGGQHYQNDAIEYDARRDEFIGSCGFTVLRYSNSDINTNFEAVCIDIEKHLID